MYGCRPRSSLLASRPSTGGCSSPILVPVPQPHACPPGSRNPPAAPGAILLCPHLPPPANLPLHPSPRSPTGTLWGSCFRGSAPVPFPFPQAVGEAVPWGWQRRGAAAGLARPLVPGRRSPPPTVLMLRVHPPWVRHHLHQEKQPQPSAQKPPCGSVQLHFRIYLK